MLNNETTILALHQRTIWKKTISIFQQAVNEDPELVAEAQITAVGYMLSEGIVVFDTQLGNISYVASGKGKMKAATEGVRR
jgi:hypothetical protein